MGFSHSLGHFRTCQGVLAKSAVAPLAANMLPAISLPWTWGAQIIMLDEGSGPCGTKRIRLLPSQWVAQERTSVPT